MEERISESEYRFMEILWETEPVSSTELVQLCREGLGWKKSTTYTVIKKLAGKQVVQNQDAVVTALVKKEEVQRRESSEFVEKRFHGSLPSFLASFLQDRKLTREEAERLQQMIHSAVEDDHYGQDVQDKQDKRDMQDKRNKQDKRDMQDKRDIQDVQDKQDKRDKQDKQDKQDKRDMQDKRDIQDVQDKQDVQDIQNMQDM